MKASVQFYRDVLGLELLYGGERAGFTSPRAKDAQSAILSNLEESDTVTDWGRLIFHPWMWMHSGRISQKKDLLRKSREMLRGASGISTCAIRMATSCHSRVRSNSLPAAA